MKRQSGIALVLVLMVTGILALLMLQVGLSAREHVARAQLLSRHAEATLLAHSREAAMFYTLLTQPWVGAGGRRPEARNPYEAAWNFRGESFSVDGVAFEIQDTSGLLLVPQPVDGARQFVALLGQLGVEPLRAERLGAQLMDAQRANPLDPVQVASPGRRGPAVFPLQSVAQLRSLPDMDEALFGRLEPLLTLYPVPGFNPLTAPAEILATRLGASDLQGVLEAREQGALDASSLYALAGFQPDETTSLYPGPALRIAFRLQGADDSAWRETTAVLRPYGDEPLAIWSRQTRRRGGA